MCEAVKTSQSGDIELYLIFPFTIFNILSGPYLRTGPYNSKFGDSPSLSVT